MVKLEYMVVESSGHSSSYLPSHIRVEAPLDQASRWSSPLNDQHQFLLLKLERPALVRSISFGKFCKSHVCNLKEFRVLAGSGPAQMFEVLHSGLRNDTETETFPFSFPSVQCFSVVNTGLWCRKWSTTARCSTSRSCRLQRGATTSTLASGTWS